LIFLVSSFSTFTDGALLYGDGLGREVSAFLVDFFSGDLICSFSTTVFLSGVFEGAFFTEFLGVLAFEIEAFLVEGSFTCSF